MANASKTVEEYRAEVARLQAQIDPSNFYDDPPSVIEPLGQKLEAARAQLETLQS